MLVGKKRGSLKLFHQKTRQSITLLEHTEDIWQVGFFGSRILVAYKEYMPSYGSRLKYLGALIGGNHNKPNKRKDRGEDDGGRSG